MSEQHEESVELEVNGQRRVVSVRGDETLLETLRDRCGTSSVRYSCGIGVCGTCTVLLDGAAVSSCLLLTSMVRGRQVVTGEGLRRPDGGAEPPAVQRAFVEAGAFQCSYCIPAMALTVHAALQRDPDATMDELVDELGGNLCRCGSYPQIRQALEALVSDRVTSTRAGDGGAS
jgi:aerobic-type carbon monoxide dehydrogenase small subunit (CoxS/CutS family)